MKNKLMLFMMLVFAMKGFAQVPSGYTIVNTHNDEITWYEVRNDNSGGLGAVYNNKVIRYYLSGCASICYSHGYFIFQYKENGLYEVYDMDGQEVNVDGKGNIVSNMIDGFVEINDKLYMQKKPGIIYDCNSNKIADIEDGFIRSGNNVYIINKENGKYGVYDLGKEKQVLPLSYGRYDLTILGDLCKVEGKPSYIFDLQNDRQMPLPSNYDKIYIEEVLMNGNGTKEFRLEVKKDNKAGVCDLYGNEIIVPSYDDVSCQDINDGHFYIVTKEGKKGVCDRNGREIVAPNYFDGIRACGKIDDFYYIVKKDGKSGVHDMYGNEIIAPKYDMIFDEKGYFRVYKNEKKGVCDMRGKELIPPIYDVVYFQTKKGHCYYETRLNDKYGIYDMEGHEIVAAKEYDKVSNIVTESGGCYYKVERNGKEGICDWNGKVIIAPKYDDVSFSEIDERRCYFIVKLDGKEGICNMDGKEIIKLMKCQNLRYDDYIKHAFTYTDASGNYVSTGVSLDEYGDPYTNAYYAYNKTIDEGEDYFDKKQYKKAVESYKKALEYFQTPEAYYNVAASYYNMEKYDDAITYFQYCLNSAANESTKKDAQKYIDESRKFIAQREARRREVAEAVVGGLVEAASTFLFYNNSGYPASTGGSNLDYLLDPNYALTQAQRETAEYQAAFQQIMQQTIQQVERENEEEYRLFRSFTGADISREEYNAIKAQAMMEESQGQSGGNTTLSSNEYQGVLSPNQYEEMYHKYERIVEGCFNNGISGGSSPTAACLQNKQTLLDAQKQMKRIRSEAKQCGVYIQESKWETATAGY